MKMDAEEKKETTSPEVKQSNYPYGLCITLNDSSLVALGLKELPAVGTVVNICAATTVTGVSEDAGDGKDTERKVSLQITDMEIEPAKKDTAAILYGGKG